VLQSKCPMPLGTEPSRKGQHRGQYTTRCVEDFQRHIEQHFHGAGGRDSHVESASGFLDFKGWLSKLGINIKGLTSTHTEPFTNHCWRFVRRQDLPKYQAMEVVVDNSLVKEPNPLDVIMLAKEYISSKDPELGWVGQKSPARVECNSGTLEHCRSSPNSPSWSCRKASCIWWWICSQTFWTGMC
jgi:hypothetical protein